MTLEPPFKKKKISWQKISRKDLDLDLAHDFLTKSDADALLDWFERTVEYFSGNLAEVKVFGKWHKIPRKQVSYGEEGLSYKFSGNTVPALPWPDELATLRDHLNSVTLNHFNFVLINRYKDGNDHMGYHRDDEAELEESAPIASLSLGQTRDFLFQHAHARRSGPSKQDIPVVKLSLTHGSLLMMNPPTNRHWYHALPKRKNCSGVRINLTFRTMKAKSKRKKICGYRKTGLKCSVVHCSGESCENSKGTRALLEEDNNDDEVDVAADDIHNPTNSILNTDTHLELKI